MRALSIAAAAAALVCPVAVAAAAPANAETVWLECDVTVDNPHYSSGAGGVIAKVRYTCIGDTTGTLTISAYIERHAAGTYGPYAYDVSNPGVVRSVGPGVTGTVYVPKLGSPGLPCRLTDWYSAWATDKLTAAGQTRSGTIATGYVHPSRCS